MNVDELAKRSLRNRYSAPQSSTYLSSSEKELENEELDWLPTSREYTPQLHGQSFLDSSYSKFEDGIGGWTGAPNPHRWSVGSFSSGHENDEYDDDRSSASARSTRPSSIGSYTSSRAGSAGSRGLDNGYCAPRDLKYSEFESLEAATSKSGRCPRPDCGRWVKDLIAHLLTHSSERPEKCPIRSCTYHDKGFARRYDWIRHTLTHYKGDILCSFCPGLGSASEKRFTRVDVFKRHLTSIHDVVQKPPRSRQNPRNSAIGTRSTQIGNITGECSICHLTFSEAQTFYEHLDDCVLRILCQEQSPQNTKVQAYGTKSSDEARLSVEVGSDIKHQRFSDDTKKSVSDFEIAQKTDMDSADQSAVAKASSRIDSAQLGNKSTKEPCLSGETSQIFPKVVPTGVSQPNLSKSVQAQIEDHEIHLADRVDPDDAMVRTCKSGNRPKEQNRHRLHISLVFWGFVWHAIAVVFLITSYFVHCWDVTIVAWIALASSSLMSLLSRVRSLVSRFPRNEEQNTEKTKLKTIRSLRILDGQEYTTINAIKRRVEFVSGEPWDWWPLAPSFRPLRLDESRLEWKCMSRHTHWSVFPREDVHLKHQALLYGTTRATAFSASLTKCGDASGSSDSGQTSNSQSTDGRSSPATSDNSSWSTPGNNAGSEHNKRMEQGASHPSSSVAVDIVPPSILRGYVMFGVQGSKRLQSSQTRLAQIDIEVHKDDDSFFNELKLQYKHLRGYLRWIFSIWVFQACDFTMFYKANPNEIMPGPEEMPSMTDMDYRFAADRYPPILSSVFITGFYGCNKACIKSKLDVMSFFHECKGRNHCGKYRILNRLPQRLKKWEIDRDEEKDEAWGLNATFGISFCMVAIYHLLIFAGPITFWGLWLRRWPTDWQNASVPFFAVVVLLSLFWLPFAHNATSKEVGKRKIT